MPSLLAQVPVLSPSRITLEYNGKIRPPPDRENDLARPSGGGGGSGIEPSPLANTAGCEFSHCWRPPRCHFLLRDCRWRAPLARKCAGIKENVMNPLMQMTAAHTSRESIISTLVAGFEGDDAMRSVYPKSDEYHEHFPGFLMAFGGRAFDAGMVDSAAGLGAAFWFPPGLDPDVAAIMAHLDPD
jgi:hypothetical protein